MELNEKSRIDLQIPSCTVTIVEQEENLGQIIEMSLLFHPRLGDCPDRDWCGRGGRLSG